MPTGIDEPGPGKHREVLGDRLPGDGHFGGQRGRGGLAVGEDEVENLPAGGIGDGLPQLILA